MAIDGRSAAWQFVAAEVRRRIPCASASSPRRLR